MYDVDFTFEKIKFLQFYLNEYQIKYSAHFSVSLIFYLQRYFYSHVIIVIILDESEIRESYRELVAVAVEHTLLVMGAPEFRLVETRLKEEYGITIKDSLDNPEHLKKILCDIFGTSYKDVLDLIYEVIDDSKDSVIVRDFLCVMEI